MFCQPIVSPTHPQVSPLMAIPFEGWSAAQSLFVAGHIQNKPKHTPAKSEHPFTWRESLVTFIIGLKHQTRREAHGSLEEVNKHYVFDINIMIVMLYEYAIPSEA